MYGGGIVWENNREVKRLVKHINNIKSTSFIFQFY
jgi:hypothetical protein